MQKAVEHSKAGCRAATPQTPHNWNLRNTNFVDIMISEVLRDFPFSQNQPLMVADDYYISMLKKKLQKLKKHCDRVMEHIVTFICI
jgi:hypothetical protein